MPERPFKIIFPEETINFLFFPEELIQLLAQLCSWLFHPNGHGLVWKGGRRNFKPGIPGLLPYSWCGFRTWFGNNRSCSLKGMSKQEIPSCVRRKEVGIPAKKVLLGKIQPQRCFKTLSSIWTLQHNLGYLNPQGISQRNPKIKENKPWTYQRRKWRRDGMIKIKKQLKGRRIQECCKRKKDFTSIYSFPQV